MDYKERWCALYEEFIEAYKREPSSEEMDDIWSSHCCGIIECYSDELRANIRKKINQKEIL